MVCFQAALGASEFDQFNRYAWKQIINKLDEDGPIKIELVRSKVSRTEVKSYYKAIRDIESRPPSKRPKGLLEALRMALTLEFLRKDK